MSLFLRHKEEGFLLGVWRMDESFEELCRLLAGTDLCRQADERFRSPQRKQEWLSVRLLLRNLAGADKEIAYLPSGKPYLADGSFHISISHTCGYVALILGQASVGIDIEQYAARVRRVASKFVRPDEQPAPYWGDDTWSLLLHWSAKEVMFKCMNSSEVDFCAHLQIFPFVPQERGEFHAREYRTEQQREFLIRYLLHPDFVLTWTVD